MKSDVERKLFQVSLIISEVDFKMSDENQLLKSQCLSAVGVILSQIENLVSSKLSIKNDDGFDPRTSDIDVPDCSSTVNGGVYDSCSTVSDDDANDKQMLWDYNYAYYNIYYDDEEQLLSSTRIEEELPKSTRIEEELPKSAVMKDEESMITTNMMDKESMITPRSASGAEIDLTISTVLAAISSIAPSSIYDKKRAMRKRRKRMKTMICPELLPIWSHAATIVTPANNAVQSVTNSYPTVDWKSVNKRFLTNIPSPVPLPVLGCSQDPADYEDVYQKNDYGGMQNLGSKFTREFPFGSALGYLTDAGAVRVPDDVFHGYVFEVGQGWILHADFPRKPELQNRRKKEVVRRKRRKNCGT